MDVLVELDTRLKHGSESQEWKLLEYEENTQLRSNEDNNKPFIHVYSTNKLYK